MPLQILLMILWLYGFSYFHYTSLLMAIMLIGTAISVGLTYRQHRMLFKLLHRGSLVPYVHKGYVKATVSHRLVPGDVIVVQQGRALCDMVLLRGNCLVEASQLTGKVRDMSCELPCSACDIVSLGMMHALWCYTTNQRSTDLLSKCKVYGVYAVCGS